MNTLSKRRFFEKKNQKTLVLETLLVACRQPCGINSFLRAFFQKSAAFLTLFLFSAEPSR
jgi:hypothetical protein